MPLQKSFLAARNFQRPGAEVYLYEVRLIFLGQEVFQRYKVERCGYPMSVPPPNEVRFSRPRFGSTSVGDSMLLFTT
jgi:hypothetical protein